MVQDFRYARGVFIETSCDRMSYKRRVPAYFHRVRWECLEVKVYQEQRYMYNLIVSFREGEQRRLTVNIFSSLDLIIDSCWHPPKLSLI